MSILVRLTDLLELIMCGSDRESQLSYFHDHLYYP